jgi:5-methylcytosine-specific restriction endonuclease McrA
MVIYSGPPFVRKPKINKNPISKRSGSLKSGQCKVCSSWFISLNVDVTCSAKCQRTWRKRSPSALEHKRAAKSRRRARQKNAFVANVYPKQVFSRDGYRCQLRLPGCKGIDRTKNVPHPKAPTVDHIIPLAVGVDAGGTHEPKNCHTACFHCNWTKSAGGGGEQLLLIG